MTIHDIVQSIYTDRRVKEFISKQQPADLQEDLLHHCIMEVYRMDSKYPGKVLELYNSKQLWPVFHGLVCRQLHSNKSTFYTRFRRPLVDIEDINYKAIPDERMEDASTRPYDAICDRFGKAFADYVFLDIERQEAARIAKYSEPVVTVKVKQAELW